MNRRRLLGVVAGAAAAAVMGRGARPAKGEARRKPRVLLRSAWQVVNIGDVAHTPGVLALLERYVPEAEVTLWASGDLTPAVAEMERRRFPGLRIVKGAIGADGKASNPELGEAVERADFLLHGSGPSLVGRKDVAAFARATGKPFGVYGITYGGGSSAAAEQERELLSAARFAFFRDSISLAKAKADGVHSAVMEFAPDGAFAVDLRDDESAKAFLARHGLEEGKFVCCIPRWRNTPYWEIKGRTVAAADLERKRARNEAMVEHDHAPLREAVVAVCRGEAGMKVLLCPEDQTQMALGKAVIYDKLPEDVRAKVVWRETFWRTDEAVSTYVRSAGLFGLEMHSPILCVGNGVPAIVCRFAEQTSKGEMWRDIGLGEWLFDFDREADLGRLTRSVMGMVGDPAAARAKVGKAMEFVRGRQRETMGVVGRAVGA